MTIAGTPRVLALVAAMMNARSRLTGIATGDQGIFVQRALFETVGGYPDQPLMEDIELSRRLQRAAGAPLHLAPKIVTSGRRWEREGPWRTILAMWRIRFAYWRGADPAQLAARYRTTAPAPRVTLADLREEPASRPGEDSPRGAIGADEAAAHYVRLVERTLATAVAARAAGVVDRVELWGTPDIAAPAFTAWAARFGVELRAQAGDDLGAKMRHALHSALSRRIVRAPDRHRLSGARRRLSLAGRRRARGTRRGVRPRGGRRLRPGRSRPRRRRIFRHPVELGGHDGGDARKLEAQHLRWHELPTLWDVDSPADLARWQAAGAFADRRSGCRRAVRAASSC